MTSPSPTPLQPTTYTQQRDQAVIELTRSLLLINGGGAVALLALLQATWISVETLRKPILVALFCFGLGAALAAVCPLLRYMASWHYQGSGQQGEGPAWRHALLISALASVLIFVAGVLYVAVMAWPI